MNKFLILFVVTAVGWANNSFAGSDYGIEDYSAERFVAIQSKIVDGYRFDITKAPVYAKDNTVYLSVKNGEGTIGDSFILVTDSSDNVVFFERMNTPRSFVEIERIKVENLKNVAVVILQNTGGGSCCEYLHLFQTKPNFKYLGREKAVYR